MGSPSELTLNCRPSITSASSFFRDIAHVDDKQERTRKYEEYIRRLEEERGKIEAFKRELPFCMQLLSDAIEASREQLADCQLSRQYENEQNTSNKDGRPVLEEFIPMSRTCEQTDDKSEENHQVNKTGFMNGEKPHWMISAQLWNPDPDIVDSRKRRPICVEESPKEQDSRHLGSLPSKHRVGGAFHPFAKERQVISPLPIKSTLERTLPDLALSSAERDRECDVGSLLASNESKCLNAAANARNRSGETTKVPAQVQDKEVTAVSASNATTTSPATSTLNPSSSQTQRKSRRCWSPELHRRFVNALQQLGGSEATPKQIRELMKVDGLTNDEVKSHLQKYRLHTRRPSLSQSANSHAPQLVVLGGIWMPPEYAAAAAAATQQGQGFYSPLSTAAASASTSTSPSLSQSHYCQPSIPSEYYSQINSASQVQLQDSMYCDQQQTPSHSHSSPQGPLHCNGHSSEARGISAEGGREESVGQDGKSDSSSWRAEEFGETTQVRVRGTERSPSLGKQPHKFLNENERDAEDNRVRRGHIEKGERIQLLGR